MKAKYLLFTLSLLLSGVAIGQNPCGNGTIVVNGQNVDAVSFDNNNISGLNLPMWLTSGATLAAGNRVQLISVIEFNEEPQSGGSGSSLVYNRVVNVGSATETVPANKVWKVENIVKQENPFPNGITSSNSSPACDGDNVTLNTATASGATYSWTGPNGFTSSNQNPIISGASLAANGTYFITVSLNGCTYTDSTIVVVDTLPNSNFTHTNLIAGYNGTFSSVISGLSYSWVFNSGTPSSSSVQNPQVQWANAGTYSVTLTVTDGNGCSSTTQQNVTVSTCLPNLPQSDFSWSSAVAGSPTTFSPDLTGETYSWSFTSGSPGTSTAQNPSVTWANDGTYNVTLTVYTSTACYTTTQVVTVAPASSSGSQTFSYTGAQQTFTVPSGVTSVFIEVWGAEGGHGANSGKGGYAEGNLTVSSGQTLYVYVGQKGQAGGIGGWNGGGSGSSVRGSGGGGSDVRYGGVTLTDRVIVAGGGGGQYSTTYSPGGNGGGLSGSDAGGLLNGKGGSQIGGGVGGTGGAPTNGTLGQGGTIDNNSISGGGGGYYGGGAGLAGGGGSGYIGGVTSGSMQTGVRSGDGQITISW